MCASENTHLEALCLVQIDVCVCVCEKWLTHSLAGLRGRVHLVAFIALTLIISFVVDADLTAGVWILTLIYVCGENVTKQS